MLRPGVPEKCRCFRLLFDILSFNQLNICMREVYVTLGVVLGIIPQFMVMRGIYTRTMKLSFSAYFVWFVLNLIIASASFLADGNYSLSLSFVLLNLLIALMVLAAEKKVSFPVWERFVAVLCLICMGVWYTTSGAYAVVAASLAVFIAGIPQFVVVYKNPKLTSPLVWSLATLAGLFAVLGGKEWSIVERFYPTTFLLYACIGLCVLLVQRQRGQLNW